jgi:2-polyprenyl-3-methyl-5-hydroxy-6-metoxy-1,4-benzoquinol methylase
MNRESLTDEQFWSDIWNLQQHKVRHLRRVYVANRQLARLFERSLCSFSTPKLLEIGCADSLWLPFLAQNYDGEVYGIDFSELGCQLAKRNLALKGVEATVRCEDFFDFAKTSPAAFDFVYSMGVIEHFTDPTPILSEMYRILKPAGRMLTVLPNLRGIYTPIAKIASPQLLAKHTVIRPVDLRRYLETIGFKVLESGFTGGALKLSVVDYSPWISTIGRFGHEMLCKLVNLTDIVVANALAAVRVPNQQLTSPYVYALCEKA